MDDLFVLLILEIEKCDAQQRRCVLLSRFHSKLQEGRTRETYYTGTKRILMAAL